MWPVEVDDFEMHLSTWIVYEEFISHHVTLTIGINFNFVESSSPK